MHVVARVCAVHLQGLLKVASLRDVIQLRVKGFVLH